MLTSGAGHNQRRGPLIMAFNYGTSLDLLDSVGAKSAIEEVSTMFAGSSKGVARLHLFFFFSADTF